jgi:putative thiamine transport system ATP-binding protein
LLDEPFGRLDVRLRTRFRQTVFSRARSHSLPTLLVTHDPDDAAAAGGPVIELAVDDGADDKSLGPSVLIPFRRRP